MCLISGDRWNEPARLVMVPRRGGAPGIVGVSSPLSALATLAASDGRQGLQAGAGREAIGSRICQGARCTREERGRGYPARRAGGVHRRIRLGKLVLRIRNAVCGSAAAISGIRFALPRRLFHQMAVPEVREVEGLSPAVALQQQRGSATTRSSVGSVATLSNLFRTLCSRAGDYPKSQPLLYAESFSPNSAEGPVRSATASAASMTSQSARWCRTTASPSANGPSRRGWWVRCASRLMSSRRTGRHAAIACFDSCQRL
jgi:hypothetical protein